MKEIKKNFSHFTKKTRSRIKCAMTGASALAEGATHVALFGKFKKCAFTLAEVLITLGIIGVVAALTLPTLIQNHQKQVYVTGLKKAYSNLSNAFNKMAYDEGVTDWKNTVCGNVGYAGNNECFDNLVKQFNVLNKKPFGTACSESWCSELDYMRVVAPLDDHEAIFSTSDGMIYIFSCGSVGVISVDINGLKGPNKVGRDVFWFGVNTLNNKVIPRGTDYNAWQYCTTDAVNENSNHAEVCAAKVLIEGKMNY